MRRRVFELMMVIVASPSAAACGSADGGDGSDVAAHESAVQARGPIEVQPELGAAYAQQVFAIQEVLPPETDDRDGDTFTADVDPDDDNPFAYPGAPEVRCDGLDEDGNGVDECPPDVDGDGALADRDCDDVNASIGPLATEVFCNGRDENCDGLDSCDRDHDGEDDRTDPAPLDPGVMTEGEAEVDVEAERGP